MLGEMGYRVTGSDLSEKFLDRSFESDHVRLVAADAMALPFPDSSFDAVCSYCFIEHVPDVPRVVDEMIRVVRPGGRILIMSPNLLSPFLVLRSLVATVRGREIAGVFPRSIMGHLGVFLRHAGLLVRMRLSSTPSFLYRTPDYTRPTVADADSSWWCTQVALLKYLRSRGLPARYAIEGYSTIGRMVARLLPTFAGECCVLAEKPCAPSIGEAASGARSHAGV
jgi:SAM-dependent methyltransferase